jgi:dethiobiotin synthetase
VSARPSLRGLFVTGTDTGVGKTTVSTALLRLAKRSGLTPIPFKPVETGCEPDPADAAALWRAALAPVEPNDVCLYRYRLPAAPALAAAVEGPAVDLDQIVRRGRELATKGDFLLVEGAGGLLVPYTESETAADVARLLGLPLLVVARTALGTINHTALTLAEITRRDLPLAGFVLNRTTREEAPHESGNATLIERLTGRAPLCTLPWSATSDPDALADLLEAQLPAASLRRLLGAAQDGSL